MNKKVFLVVLGVFLLSGVIYTFFQLKEVTISKDNESSTKVSKIDNKSSRQRNEYRTGDLILAVNQHNLKKVNLIVNTPYYKIDELDSNRNTPLNLAVHNNDVQIAKVLINKGADINLQNDMKDSPYLYAGAEGRTEILREMLKNSQPDLSKHNRYGGNALIPAAEKGHIDNVKLLLDYGQENINYQNNFGYTALIEVVGLRENNQIYQDITRILLQHGADQSITDNSGRTAADYAMQKNSIEILNILNQFH
ncbi:ankyrin repeat-containing protein [Weissella koreensis KACC 15510]|uniref:ankyrin repeat domain-containing protein n=1 Tax=Weissella koreensis TaxID=165096 RepID=UPI0002175BF0|nr:ankyrin repeat domain-containing protein [Weissella koreensis]AEJ23631.1 ankyrin repeat-containing protein [Weissella koreensis KACC 15510]